MELELGKPCPWCGGFVNDAPGIGLYCVNEGMKCTMPSPFCTDRAMGAMEEFTAPKHLRKGQALFSFLVWLGKRKPETSRTARIRVETHEDVTFFLADPFYISDDELARLWDEWVESLDAQGK